MDAYKKIIVALDFTKTEEADAFLELWKEKEKPFIKVGYALYFAAGPDWVCKKKEEGYSVFLDLKLHDIPKSVARAVKSIGKIDVDFLTLHASGGIPMMEAAREAAESIENRMKLLAVTQLTSIDQEMLNEQIGINGSIDECVVRYARLAHHSGVDGIVCSGAEVGQLRKVLPSPFLTVTPGIRLIKKNTEDQKRITTPNEAIREGANYLVIGRPITEAASPIETYNEIVEEITKVKVEA